MATSFPSFGTLGSGIDLLEAVTRPSPMAFNVRPDGDVKVVMHSMENDEVIRIELDPEYNISVTEMLRIQVLMSLLSVYQDPDDQFVLQYIRLHKLERHFKMTS